MSIIPWSSRYSARWKPSGSFSRIVFSITRWFQRAEYLLDHGMIDMVVHRKELPETLGRLIGYLAPEKAA